MDRVVKAANFAAVRHKNQKRKDAAGTPYINHPIGVANILANEGGVTDPIILQAALLHDTVEDTDTTFEELEAHFGKEVTEMVREVTDDKSLPKEERKRLQVVNAPKCSPEAKVVKLDDKLYNLRDLDREAPVGWNEERVAQYWAWAANVVEGCRGTNQQIEEELNKLFDKHCVDLKERKVVLSL